MATAADIILGALRKLGQVAVGEPLPAPDAATGLEMLNALMDSWSNEHLAVYNNVENVVNFVAGKQIYTVGNYPAGTFAGILTSGSATITGATIPPNMIVNGDLSGPGIASGTTIIAIGTNTVTMSANAVLTYPLQQIGYTIPGDFKVSRPLRITNAYTRLTYGQSAVDFPCQEASSDQYTALGLKNQPGPYPRLYYYDSGYPLAQMFIWPVSSQAGEFHFWADMLFNQFQNLTDQVQLPQGYYIALQFNLAVLLGPEYRTPVDPVMVKLAADYKRVLKNTNAAPQSTATYDIPIGQGANAPANWYLTGGF